MEDMASDVWVKEGRQTFCEERRKHFIGHCPPDLCRSRIRRKNYQTIKVSQLSNYHYQATVESEKVSQNGALLDDVLCFHINKKILEIRQKLKIPHGDVYVGTADEELKRNSEKTLNLCVFREVEKNGEQMVVMCGKKQVRFATLSSASMRDVKLRAYEMFKNGFYVHNGNTLDYHKEENFSITDFVECVCEICCAGSGEVVKVDTDKKFKKRPESITATIYNGKRKVCEVSRFCGACSSTLGVVPSTYGAHAEPQALRNLEINKDCKVCVCVSVVPCPSCARIIAQDGRVKEVRFGNSSGLNMSGVKSLLENILV